MNLESHLQGLIEFAAIGGYLWTQPPPATDRVLARKTEFALVSGDPDYYCFRESDRFVVRKEDRGQLSTPYVISDQLDDIEKFLSFTLGNSVRQKAGHSRIWLTTTPIVLGSGIDGFQFEGTPADVSVLWDDGGTFHSVSGLTEDDAEEFVQYVRFSPHDIRSSFLDPTGHPLFS